MSALFAKMVKQALITFDKANAPSFAVNFQSLKQLTDQLTFRDINIPPQHFAAETFSCRDKAPCTYIQVFQNSNFSMSVFILQDSYKMPLHDHPMMHGILRGLSGNLQINSYTKVLDSSGPVYDKNQREIPVIAEQTKLVSNNTESAVLTPNQCNFHEIRAVGGVAAFFDILSPPYEADMPEYGPRTCSFYKKFAKQSTNEKTQYVICRVPAPSSYYCDTAYYDKPDFLLDYTDTSCNSDSSSS